MKKIFDFLPRVLQKRHLLEEAFAAQMVHRMNIILEENFGEEVKKNVHAEKFWQGKIFLVVKNGAWKQQIFLHTSSLLQLLRSEFPHVLISKIVLIS